MCTPSFDSMELTFMAHFFSAVSPTSSLPTPPTHAQLPLSSLSYTTPPSTDNLRLDTTFYEGNLFVTSPFEPPFLVKPCGPFDISCLQFAESFDPIHPSIMVPASPQPPPIPAFETESFESIYQSMEVCASPPFTMLASNLMNERLRLLFKISVVLHQKTQQLIHRHRSHHIPGNNPRNIWISNAIIAVWTKLHFGAKCHMVNSYHWYKS